MTKVAVVTGSNKGIGFAIVRGLCKKFDGDVYLTSRSEERGLAAIEELKKEGLSPKFHQLDIDDRSSVEKLRDFLQQTYGGLDVLVNNAAIAFKAADTTPFDKQVEVTMQTNYFNVLMTCDLLFPLLRPGARVVHLSSFTVLMVQGSMSAEKKAAVQGATSIEQLSNLVREFISDAKSGQHKERGWAEWGYAMTKLALTAATPLQQAAIDASGDRDILINAGDPGYVNTDMTSGKGKLTIDQGAETPLYLALLPAGAKEPRGQYVSELKVQDWRK
jgi:carbonyl reductase 1